MNAVTHIGLILDGNRRYAKKHHLPIKLGHKKGADVFKQALEWLKKKGITQVTAYVLSTENLKREASQVADLFALFDHYFDELLKNMDKTEGSIHFIGNKQLFPQDMQNKMKSVEEKTAKFTKYKLNLCFGYGGREEITNATTQIAQKVKSGELDVSAITPELFQSHLYLCDEPQLIIRTGGKSRTSNFLPWQSIYSEWFYIEKMWPEMTEADFDQVFASYTEIQRNFGK